MIQFALKCDNDHSFDSWFQSASAFDTLKAAGHLSCAICGSGDVSKAIMAPRISSGAGDTATKPLQTQEGEPEKALSQLRQHVEENADYVGPRFAQEARSMYLGTAPERAIYGEANVQEAKALIDDGVPVAPLPFLPSRKAN
ncbi:hypothetical protein ROLI_025690 [Roseobacter fucihabitans]|uniref:DUF1178 domain-containing protein n=1 Tax=Roseobacter fucihabitans TaxID=1537242 RepID=A0ABZ2BTY0_9RHOB|nr:DUF1178 family protein [Roseobacter litoralis]MBC6968269.1 hypothetical protein [Roseobacter litoralis]